MQLLNQIPLVTLTSLDILADATKRVFHGKWKHSLAVLDSEKVIAVIIGYERECEKNDQYPQNTIYIAEIAVDPEYQGKGIAKRLLKLFLEHSNKIGFQELAADLNFSVQTNSAEWNQHVQSLYTSLGFEERATKVYENRVDYVYGLTSQKI